MYWLIIDKSNIKLSIPSCQENYGTVYDDFREEKLRNEGVNLIMPHSFYNLEQHSNCGRGGGGSAITRSLQYLKFHVPFFKYEKACHSLEYGQEINATITDLHH